MHEESSCLRPAPPAAQLHINTDEGAQRGECSRAAEHELARVQGREGRRTGRAAREETKHSLQLQSTKAGERARLDDQMAPAFARRHPAASIDFEGHVLGNTAADDKEAAGAGAGAGARRCGRTLGSARLGARAALGERAVGEGGVRVEGCKGRKRGAREHASGDGAALAIPSAQLCNRRTQQRAQLGGMQLDRAISLLPHAKEDRLDGLESCQPQRRAWLKHQSQGVLEEVGHSSHAHAHAQAQAAATMPRTQLTSQPNCKSAPHILAGLALGVVVCVGCGGGFRHGGGAGAGGDGVRMGGGGEGGGGCAQGGEAHKGRVRVRSGGREQREQQRPPLRCKHGEGDMHRSARAWWRRQHDGGVVR